MAVVLPHGGVLFRGGAGGNSNKLLQENRIVAIIGVASTCSMGLGFLRVFWCCVNHVRPRIKIMYWSSMLKKSIPKGRAQNTLSNKRPMKYTKSIMTEAQQGPDAKKSKAFTLGFSEGNWRKWLQSKYCLVMYKKPLERKKPSLWKRRSKIFNGSWLSWKKQKRSWGPAYQRRFEVWVLWVIKLEELLWGTAEFLRGQIDASDYKQYISSRCCFTNACQMSIWKNITKALELHEGDAEYARHADVSPFQHSLWSQLGKGTQYQ